VSGKNNKILPIPETMQGISTSAESKEERSQKKKKKKKKYSCRYKRNVERLTATGAENKLSQVKFRNIASQNSSENYFHFVLKN
jgi:hypothetical protein